MKKKNYQEKTETCDPRLRNILDATICVNDKTKELLRITVSIRRLSPFCSED